MLVRKLLILTLLVFVASLTQVGLLSASQKDEQLDQLFKQLQGSKTLYEAKITEQQIRLIWFESGDEAINILMRKGVVSIELKEYAQALQTFNYVIKKRPDYAEAWNKRALIYFLTGRYEKSFDDIQKVLALEPRHFNAFSGLGFVFTQMRKYDDALNAFRAVTALHPHYQGISDYIENLQKVVNATRA